MAAPSGELIFTRADKQAAFTEGINAYFEKKLKDARAKIKPSPKEIKIVLLHGGIVSLEWYKMWTLFDYKSNEVFGCAVGQLPLWLYEDLITLETHHRWHKHKASRPVFMPQLKRKAGEMK